MERLGIIADVSHLGDKGILDVISHAKRPFVASHSGARAVCRHCRNLTDEMIRGIGEKGGVMGVNYFTEFLRDKEKFGDPMKTSLDDMVAHIRRIIRVGGIDSVGRVHGDHQCRRHAASGGPVGEGRLFHRGDREDLL